MNESFTGQLKDYMKKIGVPFSVLKPMSKDQMEAKRRRIEANKGIVKPNITIDQVKRYIDDGADPNASNQEDRGSSEVGIPLVNAVKESNLEKAEYLIEKGAMPGICDCLKYATSFPMLKLLIRNNAVITPEIFKNYADDYKAVRYLLDFGIDPNFKNGFPIRTAVGFGNRNVVDLLFTRGVDFAERNYLAIKNAIIYDATKEGQAKQSNAPAKPNLPLLRHLLNLAISHKYSTIEDCKICKGDTEVSVEKGTRNEHKEDCPHCKGSGKEPNGRSIERTIKVSRDVEYSSFKDNIIEQIINTTFAKKEDKNEVVKLLIEFVAKKFGEDKAKELKKEIKL
jgi:hypothetical protein